jgi:type I restriction enzyme M protein
LDYKNPNKVEEDLGDPLKMLEKFKKAEQEMEALQNSILNELKKTWNNEKNKHQRRIN